MTAKLKIGTRLAIGFLIMLLLMIVITVISMRSLALINQKVDIITVDKWPKVVMLHDIKDNINISARALRNAIILDDPNEIKQEITVMAGTRKHVNDLYEKLEKDIQTPEGKAVLASIKEQRAAYIAAQKAVMAAIEAGNKSEAQEALKKFQPLQLAYFDLVSKFIDIQAKEVVQAGEIVGTTKKHAEYMLLATLVVSLVCAAIIGFLIAMSITRPLNKAIELNRSIANGNLAVTIDDDRGDEIGKLNESARQMVENLRQIVVRLSSTSDQVASASSQLHSTAEQMATASEEVAAQAATVATAGEEMSATAGDIAQSCFHAAEGSRHASQVATEGVDVVSRTVEVMSRIAEKVQTSARTVENLGERSDQIGAIVGTIEDIADQTNLLALNAAIEAARAGEQGRGFAVVADEVRALAERTTKATKEISDMIKGIQKETKGAVSIMEDGVREVESGTTEASRSGSSLQEILDQINAVTMQVSQIATAAEEQTATTGEISNNMQQMSEVVQQTARGARESSQAASGLAGLAEDLKGMVGQFKL